MGDNNKPFLKWAGGKTRLSDFIAGHFPGTCRHRLIEPFAGSAALSCMLEFDHYCLSDVNPDLMSVYASLKEHGQDFIDYARSFFTLQNNHKDRFHALRTTFNRAHPGELRAALFIYLNRHAFNGLCRYNSKGEFNAPFGAYKKPFFPEGRMQAFVRKSSRMDLFCQDFRITMRACGPDDLIYCDPPYDEPQAAEGGFAFTAPVFNRLRDRKSVV